MKKKIIIFGSIGVGLTVVGFLINKFVKDKNGKNTKNTYDQNDDIEAGRIKMNSTPIVGCSENAKFPLKRTTFFICSYDNVEKLQKLLNSKSSTSGMGALAPIKEDGKFGKNTEKRLKEIFNIEEVSESFYNKEVVLDNVIDNVVWDTTFLTYDLKSPIL